MFLPYYSPNSWNTYLQAEHIIQGVNTKTGKAVAAVAGLAKTVNHVISEQTREIVGSNEAIAQVLQGGFGGLEHQLRNIYSSIEDLGASFSYGIGLVVDQLVIQNQTLRGIAETLEKLYEASVTPTQTQAKELFLMGSDLLSQGLLDKALEYFHKAEAVYEVDFFTQFNLGKLYLYGKNEDSDVIDIEKAEKHLRLAARYGAAQMSKKPQIKKLVAEAFFHTSMTCYLQATEQLKKGKWDDTIEQKLEDAFRLATKTIELNPKLSEAHYHAAKYLVVLSDVEDRVFTLQGQPKIQEDDKLEVQADRDRSLERLEDAIKFDRNYVIKVALDKDFDSVRDFIERMITEFRDTERKKVEERLGKLNGYLNEPPIEYDDSNELYTSYGYLRYLENFIDVHGEIPEYITPTPRGIEPNYLSNSLFKEITTFRQKAQEISAKAVTALEINGYLDLLSSSDSIAIIEKGYKPHEDRVDNAKVYDPKQKFLEKISGETERYAKLLQKRVRSNQCILCGEQRGFFEGLGLGKRVWYPYRGTLMCDGVHKNGVMCDGVHKNGVKSNYRDIVVSLIVQGLIPNSERNS